MNMGELVRRWRRGLAHAWLSLNLQVIRKVTDLYYGLVCAKRFAITPSQLVKRDKRKGKMFLTGQTITRNKRNWRYAVMSVRTIFDPCTPDKRAQRYAADELAWAVPHWAFYRRLRVEQASRRDAPTRHLTKLFFKAVEPPDKIIWVRPEDLTYKTYYDLLLYCNDILPGDWDLRKALLERTQKCQSLVQHFRDGVRWEQTVLFTDIYPRRFARGHVIRGCRNIRELAEYYEVHIRDLHESISEHGFRVEINPKTKLPDIPHVHIGRDGCLLVGNNGNHRLFLAKLLGVERIPCVVRARHLRWQQLRECVARSGPEPCWSSSNITLATHPDLADLLQTVDGRREGTGPDRPERIEASRHRVGD